MQTINNDTMGVMMSFMKVHELDTLKKVSTDFKSSIEHNKRKYNEMKLREIYGENIFKIFDYSDIKDITDNKNHLAMVKKMINKIIKDDIKYKVDIFITIYDHIFMNYHNNNNNNKLEIVKMLDIKVMTKNQQKFFNGFESVTRYWVQNEHQR